MQFDSEYDGIILGSGHNGLVLQAYLCRAGLKVLCLERNDTAGGGLRTEQLPGGSGFHHNTHSFYHRALTRMPCSCASTASDLVRPITPCLLAV